jgi:subtilase family serine protease
MRRVLIGSLVVAVLVGGVVGGAAAQVNGPGGPRPPFGRFHRRVCAAVAAGPAWACEARVETDQAGQPLVTPAPAGFGPSQVEKAYGFPTASTAGAGKTIAIVDAQDDPTAEADLATFDTQYGLPACTTANGCFHKVSQTGTSRLPRADSGWALEISLDVQWAHAIAPGAKILLVEASSASFSNLLAAEDYARAHAQYVSNSWGAGEFFFETAYDSHFVQSGVSFFVAAGDSGATPEYPSTSPNVVSVGGTTLTLNGDGSVASETGWSGGGGGCSAYETRPAAQASFAGIGNAGCGTRRATPDVSSDADPNSGVAVYDGTPYQGVAGWFVVGGTSASTPVWAARSADSGAVVNASTVYGTTITYRDITVGNNGKPCLVGYDLCSGRGSRLG